MLSFKLVSTKIYSALFHFSEILYLFVGTASG